MCSGYITLRASFRGFKTSTAYEFKVNVKQKRVQLDRLGEDASELSRLWLVSEFSEIEETPGFR